ncbi:MAG TPA: permease, partial [Solirubrobacter sp.]|nr:permease [Solirubrobacter sp.]
LQPRLAVGFAVVGALVALSPYLWLPSWRGTGFSTAYLPFHLWCWLPFAALALVAPALGRRVGIALSAVLVAGTVGAILLSQSYDPAARAVGIALPGLLALGSVAAWGLTQRTPGVVTPPLLAALGALLVGTIAFGRLAHVGDLDRVQTFLVIGTSIAVEALPFVLLGAGVSAAIAVFVPERWFAAIARLPLPLQIPSVALAGLAMPVCECGSVPVARRLIVRGVHPAAGIAFMLSAPVINPVVLLSTAVAYRGRGAVEMVLGRATLGLVVAIAAGALIARGGAGRLVAHARDHDHQHDHSRRGRAFVDHLGADLLLMGKFIVLGAALAAAMQTIVPQSLFTGVLTSPFVGALLMVALAFLLSLCSEADAFVAVSFIQFPLGPQLAFLAAGPVLDTKLALLYGGTFGRAFVVKLAVVVVPLVVAGSMLFQAVV